MVLHIGLPCALGGVVFEALALLVSGGTGYAVVVEVEGDPSLVLSREKHGKDTFHNLGGLRVNQ